MDSVKRTALLIDDDEVIRDIGRDMLNLIGISCITAENGESGIKRYLENISEISFVILDVQMPGITGEKVYRKLVEINPDIKILIASGYGKEYLETRFFKERILHYMPKPFQLKQLSHHIKSLFTDN